MLAAAVFGIVPAAVKQHKRHGPASGRIIGPIDLIIILLLCVIYGAGVYHNLGDRAAPETVYDIAENSVKIEFTTPIYVDGVWLYPCGNEINGASDIIIGYTSDGQYSERRIESYSVFAWRFASLGRNISDITVYTDCSTLTLGEIGILGADGLVEVGSDFVLFDEQGLIPDRSDYMNSAYFDEIYHTRTAYEYINDIPAYEWTHPPLGKTIISLGIRIFGMNPFGWRFMSALFGCAMIAAVYVFAKMMFGNTAAALIAALLMCVDFMHFVQSRIGTVDVFLAFFMLMMYLFMYRYFSRCTVEENRRIPWISLLMSALFLGLAVSVKWSAAYGVIGLAAVGLYTVLQKNYPANKSVRIKHIAAAVSLFVIVPLAVYVLSYIPFTSHDGSEGLAAIIGNQSDILEYHGKDVVAAEHEYNSQWYTWPLDIRPVRYYTALYSETESAGISTFGNPVVWIGGLAALAANVYFAIRDRDKNSAFLCAVYFSSWLPWMFIARGTFIYHYYPCVGLLVLMTANCFVRLYRKSRKTAVCVSAVYIAAAVLLFVLFLPVLTGQPLVTESAGTYLNWLNTWHLI